MIILYCFAKQQQLLDLTSLEKFTLEFQTSKYQLMINKWTVDVMLTFVLIVIEIMYLIRHFMFTLS